MQAVEMLAAQRDSFVAGQDRCHNRHLAAETELAELRKRVEQQSEPVDVEELAQWAMAA